MPSRPPRFLGIEQDTAAGELLTAAQSGQALLRDGDGRVGYVQILPAEPELHAAFDTTPRVPDAGGGSRPHTAERDH